MSGDTEADPSPPAAGADERSRRGLLSGGGGALAAAALVLAGCTSKVKQPSHVPITPHTPGAPRDVQILNSLLSLEYRSIYAYTATIPLLPKPKPPSKKPQSPSLFSPPKPVNKKPPPLKLMVPLAYAAAQQFLTQELAHVRELTGFIHQAGGHAHPPAPSYALGPHGTKRQVLELLHRTENELLAGYHGALTLLTPGELRGAAAAIFANHAQHTSVLRLDLGLEPIPSAFVTGPE